MTAEKITEALCLALAAVFILIVTAHRQSITAGDFVPILNQYILPQLQKKSDRAALPMKPVPLSSQQQFLPPKEYDHAYNGKLTILRVSGSEVRKACNASYEPMGCAHRNHSGPFTCTIWIMTDAELNALGYYYDIILAHEVGHCNGWRH